MNRRNFIINTLTAAGISLLPSGVRYLQDDSDNWWALREQLKLMARSCKIESFELEAEKDGFRKAHVRTNEGPFAWFQPWSIQRHWQDNMNYNFSTCVCGAKAFEQHHHQCKHATHLAWKLEGDFEKYRA